MRLSSLLAASALALASLGLAAQDASFGVQAGAAFPTGDLKTYTDNRIGFMGGAHVLLDLGDGHAVRPRIDYMSFAYKPTFYGLKQTSIGADYMYFLDGRTTEGVYFDAGLGYASNKYTAADIDYSRTSGKVYIALGAGYQVTDHIGAEVRYTGSKFTDPDGTTSVNAMTVAMTYRF